jgi:galactofuranosylgalactofuranosylrhamnosyl-N-acetylglucosaminyl-diphospho-decaprenol beta-1,5/1,6-galactofuranosyltransferase
VTTTNPEATTEDVVVRRVLQRVILPADADVDVLPLYVDNERSTSIDPAESASSASSASSTSSTSTTETVTETVGAESLARPENIIDRHRVRIPAGTRVSFGTYFNAFAAAYWRRWTVVKSVELHVTVSGEGTVIVYRSTADGRAQRVESAGTADDPSGRFSFDLTLKPFGDGGWYWFDISAGHQDAVLEEASFVAEVPASHAEVGTATVGITTMNRPEFCVELLSQIAADDDVTSILDEVLVTDQGSDLVSDAKDFPTVESALGGRLRYIRQGNIGGSGGFARAQLETLQAGRSTYALMLDDDIVLEPESIVRAVTFGDLCSKPTIVGGHMFSLYARSRLNSFGERVDLWRFWWEPVKGVKPEHDFAYRNLRKARWMHRRIDVDYNGWWMCLIPTTVLNEIGLSLPLFIKWDDAEYGIRAKEAGYRTVSMPGVAVWHVPWTDKNDALDWQAYFHQRNRTVGALLHSPYRRGGRLVRESFNHQVKHVLAMQYSVAELRLLALEDILAGPEQLHPDILAKLAQIRSVRASFVDARTDPDPGAFPAVRRSKPPRRGKEATEPRGMVGRLFTAAMGTVRQVRPVRALSRRHPEAWLAAMDARWWMLSQFDSAVVSTADGTSASWYRRDLAQARELMRRTIAIHQRLYIEWDSLVDRYRQALPEITSPQAWEKTFESARPDDSAGS